MTQNPDFIFNFSYKEENYVASVWHYSQLSIKEKLDYQVTENTYLVLLSGPQEVKPFEIFHDEEMDWKTKSTFVVDPEIVEIVGEMIDRKTL